MKKRFAFILAGILFLAISVLIPSCKEEIYTDEEALAAMKEGLKYKNDLEKELMALSLTNQIQLLNLASQLSVKEMVASDSLQRIGSKTIVSIQVKDVTGLTADLSGFDVTVNQGGVATTLTTDANGLVVFPSTVAGSASFVVAKTGFARAAGILIIEGSMDKETTQQSIIIPVFPTDAATSTISGTLTAQLDLTTKEKEIVEGGVVSITFDDIWEIFEDPNSTFGDPEDWGIAAIVYDGGFMQSVTTGADGKYEFKIPKTKNEIGYILSVSTMQKKQKLLFGDYPDMLDSIKLDTMMTWFGYYAGTDEPVYDDEYLGYSYYRWAGGTWSYPAFSGLNVVIDAPEGAEPPTQEAQIDWAHNDSTVVTWSFTRFASTTDYEYTKITQDPVFTFEPDEDMVEVVTPTAGVAMIENQKLTSLYMTNGGLYKEYGRNTGAVAPVTAQNPEFLFLEQLSEIDETNWADEDTTYATALASSDAPVLDDDVVIIPFIMDRKGKGYTAIPNIEIWVEFNTPGDPNPGDSSYYFTEADMDITLDAEGRITEGYLTLPAMFETAAHVSSYSNPTISTYQYAGNWQVHGSSTPVYVQGVGYGYETWKADLTNGLKIQDGGLGYKTAPKLLIKNYAFVQGSDNSFMWQTIATAQTTIDADGRIISVADPVMLDNYVIRFNGGSRTFFATNDVLVPANEVEGLTQAYARALVDEFGTITEILLWDEDDERWTANPNGGNYFSGRGYTSVPNVKVNAVGTTTGITPAVLRAFVTDEGRIDRIVVVDGGKGYIVKNDPDAIYYPNDLVNYFETNGASNLQYDIDLGSGYRGDAIDIFDWDY